MGVRDVAVRGVRAGGAPGAPALVGLIFVAAFVVAACGPSVAPLWGPEATYLRDPASRRRALVDSLVTPDNAYSALRLARYATGAADDWDRLPSWNPRAVPVSAASLDAPPSLAEPLPAEARALEVPDEATFDPPSSWAALVALGEEAFFRYPAQLATATLPSPTHALAARYGLWVDGARGVGGLVRAEVPGGSALALTCATCHADVVAGSLVPGLPSARFDLGLVLADGAGGPGAARGPALLAWGAGRVDVTTDDASLPARISDLRSTRWLTHLHYDATVRQADVVALAIRLETLIIVGHGQSLRPPRLVALALASYLWSLGDALPVPPPSSSAGAALFAARCAACHAGPGLTGAPRSLAEIGTDPALGLSPDRGTGMYRVPSLRGVAARPTLLHDGTLSDVEALLDPARLAPTYASGPRGPDAVPGHTFGLDLTSAERAALATYVRGL